MFKKKIFFQKELQLIKIIIPKDKKINLQIKIKLKN